MSTEVPGSLPLVPVPDPCDSGAMSSAEYPGARVVAGQLLRGMPPRMRDAKVRRARRTPILSELLVDLRHLAPEQ